MKHLTYCTILYITRSSTAAARRLSRASTAGGGGIVFEELLATVPAAGEADTRQRLERLLQLAVSSSLRTTLDTFRDDEDGDMEDVAKDVAMNIRNNKLDSQKIVEAVKVIDGGVEIDGDIVGGELKKLKEYTDDLEKEKARWKEEIAERKELLRNAEKNVRAVAAGELTITEDRKWTLSGEERLKLKKMSDAVRTAASQLEEAGSGAGAEVRLREISTSCVQRAEQRRLDSDKLGQAVRQLTARADTIGNKL